MERLVEWNCKEKNSALPKCINEFGDVVSMEDICAQLATIYDILGDCDLDYLEQLCSQRMTMRDDVAARMKLVGSIPLDRLRELVEADRDGRCAILSAPMKPMVQKPNDTDVYCPRCGETLSGGWPCPKYEDYRKMCQCPNCGESIDDNKVELQEATLKG